MDKKLISKELIAKDLSIKTKEQLFDKIASLLKDAGYTKNKKDIYEDLVSREKQGSTAFEYGLVIPHARSTSLKETKIVVVEFADSDFESIDGEKSNFAVSIIVPKEIEQEHLTVLAKISSLLSTKDQLNQFKKLSAQDKVSQLNDLMKEEKSSVSNDDSSRDYDFVAVTSCAAGIAHTYMAKDALLNAAKKLGLKAKVETRGASTENVLKRDEIDHAKFVIIAADVDISKTPFLGKKILVVNTNDAIRDGEKCIRDAQDQPVFYGKGQNLGKLKVGTTSKKSNLGKAIMSAISFMIPIVIVGGILMAIPNALAAGGNQSGGTWHFPNQFSEALWQFGHVGLLLMVPILSMFLAYRIGGKAAMPAALIGGFFINSGEFMGKYSLISLPQEVAGNASAGYLGGLVVGIMVGYMVKWMTWIKWHKSIKPVANLMFVPLISGFITYVIILYVIGSPMTWIMSELYLGLSKISSQGIWVNMLIGALFAGLVAIDLGGPINKTALVVATVIFTDTLQKGTPNFVPQTAVQAAISVPPLAMWLSTLIFKKKFSITERTAGKAALPMGLVGITEGALPFAFATPLKAIAANVLGSVVAGGLVSLADVHFYGGLGSPLGAWIGFQTNGFYGLIWIACIFAGVIASAVAYGFMRKKDVEFEKAYLEDKTAKRAEYAKKGLTTTRQIAQHVTTDFFKQLPDKIKYMVNVKHWFEKPDNWGESESEI